MWKIYEHKNVVKKLNSLPLEILKRYEKWKDIVAITGPNGLKQIKGFYDEPLKGYRSSRLNIQHRIIYKIENEHFFVQIVKVTVHDYRKK